jgi:hypothetical protein
MRTRKRTTDPIARFIYTMIALAALLAGGLVLFIRQ